MTSITITGDSNDTNFVFNSANSSILFNTTDISSGETSTETSSVTEISYITLELTGKEKTDLFLQNLPQNESLGLLDVDDFSGVAGSYTLNNLYSFTQYEENLDNIRFSASVLKPYVSLLFGAAVKDGLLQYSDLDDPSKCISTFFPQEFSGTILDVITIDELISNRSGLPDDMTMDDYTAGGAGVVQALQDAGVDFIPISQVNSASAVSSETKTLLNSMVAPILVPQVEAQLGLPADSLNGVIPDNLLYTLTLRGLSMFSLLNAASQPIYTYKTDGKNNSENMKIYTPGSGKPSDIAPTYSTLAFDIALIVLQKIVCDSSNATLFGTPQGITYFNEWRKEKLDIKLNETITLIVYDNVFIFGGGIALVSNHFMKKLALLIKNNGILSGEQIIDASFMSDINNTDLSVTKYTMFTDGKYYFRGITQIPYNEFHGADPSVIPNQVIFTFGGLGNNTVRWTENKLITVLQRSTSTLNKSNYSSQPQQFDYDSSSNALNLGIFDAFFKFGTNKVPGALLSATATVPAVAPFLIKAGSGSLSLDDWRNLIHATVGIIFPGLNKEECSMLALYPNNSNAISMTMSVHENLLTLESLLGIKLLDDTNYPVYSS